MAWIVRLVSLGADGAEHSTDVLQIAKPGDLTDLASLGLTLAEGKRILAGVQQGIVAAQARVHAVRRPECRSCGTACRVNLNPAVGLSRFGRFWRDDNPRWLIKPGSAEAAGPVAGL